MNQAIAGKQACLDAYTAGELPGRTLSWLHDLRERALARFVERGFPTTRDEHWKYTDVSAIERESFEPAPAKLDGVTAEALAGVVFAGLPAPRLVFVNGRYVPALSTPAALPAGATLGSLGETLARAPQRLEPYLGRQSPVESHAFLALNTALMTDGAFLDLAPGTVVETPIHLIFMASDIGGPHMAQVRNLVVAGEESRATLIEHYNALSETRYFTNVVTEVAAAPGAELEHYRLQQESAQAFHVSGLHGRFGRDARFTSHAVDLGGRLVRNDVVGVLEGEGAECFLNGLYVVDGRRHVDNHLCVDHVKPRGTSRQFYKGLLDGQGRAVFNGRTVVRAGAQHAEVRQLNKNLLLSRDAEVDTKPQLEIYADDVKCSHGAAVGQLDPDALFYLRSRGLDETAARDLLTRAFAHDLLSSLRFAPLREHVERQLVTRLLHGRRIQDLEPA